MNPGHKTYRYFLGDLYMQGCFRLCFFILQKFYESSTDFVQEKPSFDRIFKYIVFVYRDDLKLQLCMLHR